MANNRVRAITVAAEQYDREASQLGDIYFKAWAMIGRRNEDEPRHKNPVVHYNDARYPDPEGAEIRRRIFLAERAYPFVNDFVNGLDATDRAIVLGAWCRLRERHEGVYSWREPIRKWKLEDIAAVLKIPRSTFYDRRRKLCESLAQSAMRNGVVLPE